MLSTCVSIQNQEHNVANAVLNHLHGYIKLCWWICCIVLTIDYPASVGSGRTRCDARCDANAYQSQRTHGVTTTSLFRQNDVAASFRRNNDIIITPSVRWDATPRTCIVFANCACKNCVPKEDLCVISRYLGQGQVIASHSTCGV